MAHLRWWFTVTDTMSRGPAPRARGNQSRQNLYYAGAGVVLVGVFYLYRRNKTAKAQAAAAANQPAAAPTTIQGTSGLSSGDISALASILSQAGAPSQPSQSGVYTPPSNEKLLGSRDGQGTSYGVAGPEGEKNIVSDSQGIAYQQVGTTNWKSGSPTGTFGELVNAGTPLYFQPAPGIFSPFRIGQSKLGQNAPVYVKV